MLNSLVAILPVASPLKTKKGGKKFCGGAIFFKVAILFSKFLKKKKKKKLGFFLLGYGLLK